MPWSPASSTANSRPTSKGLGAGSSGGVQVADASGDFVVALVIYLMRCIEDGDTDTLGRMGFGPQEVEELSALRISDIHRIRQLKSHLDIHIKIDKEAFAELTRRIRAERRSTNLEREFIRADAPLDMMRMLFGTANREYTKMRHFYAVSSVGRPQDPSEARLRSFGGR